MGFMMIPVPKECLEYSFILVPITRIRGMASDSYNGKPPVELSTFFIDDSRVAMGVFKEHFFEDIFSEDLYTKTFETE